MFSFLPFRLAANCVTPNVDGAFPPLIYDRNCFDGVTNMVDLSPRQVTTLITGYFRIYDTKAENPKEIIDIVLRYFGIGCSLIYCISDHKPTLVLINKLFMISDDLGTNGKNALQILSVIDSKNIKLSKAVTRITFKFTYNGSKCCKHNCIPSWSQVGFLYTLDTPLFKKRFQKKTINSIIPKIISQTFSLLQNSNNNNNNYDNNYDNNNNNKNTFGNFIDAAYKFRLKKFSGSKNGLNFEQYCINYTHTDESDDIDNKAKHRKININDTIEMEITPIINIDKKIIVNALFSVGRYKDETNMRAVKPTSLDKNRIYLPGIAIKGCNCQDKDGGVSYQVSWKMETK